MILYFFFFIGQILSDVGALFACLLVFRKRKARIFGVLALWFTSHLLTTFLSMISDYCFGWNPVHLQNISTVLESTLLVYFCQLLISKEWKIWKILYFLSFFVFGIELYLSEVKHVAFSLTAITYYLTVCGLFIWIMYKEKIAQDILQYIYILFFFHMSVVIYIANLDVIISDIELFEKVYPIVWLIYITFNIFSIRYFQSYLKKLRSSTS
jgi:hypothetical protein